MPKTTETLKEPARIRALFRENQKISLFPLTILIRGNSQSTNTFLFCAPKKIGKAVVRNRIKRILREEVRRIEPTLPSHGWDIGIIAGKALLEKTATERVAIFQKVVGAIAKL